MFAIALLLQVVYSLVALATGVQLPGWGLVRLLFISSLILSSGERLNCRPVSGGFCVLRSLLVELFHQGLPIHLLLDFRNFAIRNSINRDRLEHYRPAGCRNALVYSLMRCSVLRTKDDPVTLRD